jgi:hypothetical protein
LEGASRRRGVRTTVRDRDRRRSGELEARAAANAHDSE